MIVGDGLTFGADGLGPKLGLISSIVKLPSPFLSSSFNDFDAALSSSSEMILSPSESRALRTGNDHMKFSPKDDGGGPCRLLLSELELCAFDSLNERATVKITVMKSNNVFVVIVLLNHYDA